MCGRVVQKTPLSEIRVLFETVNPVPNAAPTYNGAPTDTLPVVRLDRDGRRSLEALAMVLGSLLGEGRQDRCALHQRDG
jgi:putative SOS response-associated peptidase YedK